MAVSIILESNWANIMNNYMKRIIIYSTTHMIVISCVAKDCNDNFATFMS